jgi:hypothetical protein
MRRAALALTFTAAVALGVPTVALAQNGPPPGHDDVTSHPGPGRRLVCLDGVRELYLTPEEENVPGTAPIPGPCVPSGGTIPETREIVTLCIQGVTTAGPKGSANPNGYPYHEGPREDSTTTTAKPPGAMRARPRFTG